MSQLHQQVAATKLACAVIPHHTRLLARQTAGWTCCLQGKHLTLTLLGALQTSTSNCELSFLACALNALAQVEINAADKGDAFAAHAAQARGRPHLLAKGCQPRSTSSTGNSPSPSPAAASPSPSPSPSASPSPRRQQHPKNPANYSGPRAGTGTSKFCQTLLSPGSVIVM